MWPTAFGWIDFEVSTAPDWDAAQVERLARRLGYRLVWPQECSVLSVADQVRGVGADVVILPSPYHLGPLELNRLMGAVDVETVLPRLSFAQWAVYGLGR
ncbi:hypothetical protein GCM10023318_34270 [Nocardia callitridis]|uniref:Uncharacterized protein n=2 Tax=Nocardia callitridis TaxID=648753 RepID=A0ABP9KDN8_9NOCA